MKSGHVSQIKSSYFKQTLSSPHPLNPIQSSTPKQQSSPDLFTPFNLYISITHFNPSTNKNPNPNHPQFHFPPIHLQKTNKKHNFQDPIIILITHDRKRDRRTHRPDTFLRDSAAVTTSGSSSTAVTTGEVDSRRIFVSYSYTK
uniref:Uncharacterized protein n=1 Tax=Helianthus annuus TaxID=4232 RepID=A0A251T5K4_HELAN